MGLRSLHGPKETIVIEHNTRPQNKKTRDTTVLMDVGVTGETGFGDESNRERVSTTFWASAPEYTRSYSKFGMEICFTPSSHLLMVAQQAQLQ